MQRAWLPDQRVQSQRQLQLVQSLEQRLLLQLLHQRLPVQGSQHQLRQSQHQLLPVQHQELSWQHLLLDQQQTNRNPSCHYLLLTLLIDVFFLQKMQSVFSIASL